MAEYGGQYVAYTPIGGTWEFTLADTPERAMQNLLDAISAKRVLCYPLDNPISAVPYEPAQHDGQERAG